MRKFACPLPARLHSSLGMNGLFEFSRIIASSAKCNISGMPDGIAGAAMRQGRDGEGLRDPGSPPPPRPGSQQAAGSAPPWSRPLSFHRSSEVRQDIRRSRRFFGRVLLGSGERSVRSVRQHFGRAVPGEAARQRRNRDDFLADLARIAGTGDYATGPNSFFGLNHLIVRPGQVQFGVMLTAP